MEFTQITNYELNQTNYKLLTPWLFCCVWCFFKVVFSFLVCPSWLVLRQKAVTHKTLLIPTVFVVINRFTHDNLQNISDINNLRRALYYIAMKQQKIMSKLFICTKLRSVQYSKITQSNLREFITINIILLINK